MSTNRDIVTKALRESGIIEIGTDPEADKFEETLDLLQELYSSFFGNELGEQLTDVNYGTNGLTNGYALDSDSSQVIDSTFVPTNIRLILNVDAAETLYLHPNPTDGARFAVIDNSGNLGNHNVTLQGNGRNIENANNVVLATNSINREWFYRADLGTWTRVTGIEADDESPLPKEFNILLRTALAIMVNPRYGAQTSQETSDILKRAKKQFRARYRQVMQQDAEDALLFIPSNRPWRYTNSANNFNRGRLA